MHACRRDHSLVPVRRRHELRPFDSLMTVAPLSTRSDFGALRRNGRRSSVGNVRDGALWCRFAPDSQAIPPLVAFALSRKVGPAVQRNRFRRRMKPLLQNVSLPAGRWLFGVQHDDALVRFNALPSTELRRRVEELVQTATDRADVGRTASR